MKRAYLAGSIASMALLAGLSAAQAETLTLWSGSPEMEPYYRHVAEVFAADHPDFALEIETISLRDHEQRVAFALPAGQAADIVEMQSESPRYVQSGLLNPAPEAVAALVNDPAVFDPVYAAAVSDGETVYGMPIYHGQATLFYNLDKFAAAGIDAPPATMAEFSDYAARLAERDANGNLTSSGWSMRLSGGGQGIAEKFLINLHQFGGGLMEGSGEAWHSTLASEAARETLKQYLNELYVANTVTVDMKADAEAFQLGQTAMFIRESWVISDTAIKAPDLNYATAPMPVGAMVVPASLFVPRDDDKSDLAWEFIQAANDHVNLQWLVENVGWLPSRSNVDYTHALEAVPQLEGFLNHPEGYTYFSLPPVAPLSEILTRLAAHLQAGFDNPALAGDDAAIDALLKAASDEIDSILAREGLAG